MGLQQRKIRFDSEDFPHYFLCTYIPKSFGSDLLSQSLVHFKDGNSPHHQAWTECAVEELKKIRELKECYVIRALGHQERNALYDPDKPANRLNTLTAQASNALRATYLANFLEKVRDTRKLATSHFTKQQREDELHNVYRFTSPGMTPKQILIIDDILTTGATICAIIAAVLKACPSVNISVFTLAHTDYTEEINAGVNLKGKSYSWQPNEGWMLAAEDSPDYATTLVKLKQCIMNNSFV